MEHHNNNAFGILCGIVGGMIKYLFVDPAFWGRVAEAGITAFLCGILGALGTWCFNRFIKRKTVK